MSVVTVETSPEVTTEEVLPPETVVETTSENDVEIAGIEAARDIEIAKIQAETTQEIVEAQAEASPVSREEFDQCLSSLGTLQATMEQLTSQVQSISDRLTPVPEPEPPTSNPAPVESVETLDSPEPEESKPVRAKKSRWI